MKSVKLSEEAAGGLSRVLNMTISTSNQPEMMAWVVMILEELEDRPEWFPRGKWATIHHIQDQLQDCVAEFLKKGVEG